MLTVCQIDKDSLQCEVFQFLFGEQTNIVNKKLPEPDPKISDEARRELKTIIEERKIHLATMESSGQIKLTRMYNALKQAQEWVCDVNPRSKPCDTALFAFMLQTDIETGKKLNPSPQMSIEEKKNIRKHLAQKHPKLDESGKLTLESYLFWEAMQPSQ